MAKKVSKADLMKKAARLKIKGRSSMNKAQLEKAVAKASGSGQGLLFKRTKGSLRQTKVRGGTNRARDLQRRAKLPGKRRAASGRTYYERRVNRSDQNPSQMLGDYSGFENAAAFYFAIEMSNDQDLYKYFKTLINQGVLLDGEHLAREWRDIIDEEIADVENCGKLFHFSRSRRPLIAEMAVNFYNSVSLPGWDQIFEDFVSE
jgi:hypothetical protein